jgi:predicted Zn-dependent protease
MLNVLVSVGLALAAALLAAAFNLPWYAGIAPAVFVFPIAFYLLSMRTNRAIQAALAPLGGLLQERKVDEARALLQRVSDTWGPWQLYLKGQLQAQVGMLDYLQLRFDEALPQLEAAAVKDWTTLSALAAIHFRRGRHDAAAERLAEAAKQSPKEAMAHILRGVLLARMDRGGKGREEALVAVQEGLTAIPDQPALKRLRHQLSNKLKVDLGDLQPEAWFQFFPEEITQAMLLRGTRGAPRLPDAVAAQRAAVLRGPAGQAGGAAKRR